MVNILASPRPILSELMKAIENVGREGFEPSKAQGQQIYSLPQLTALVSTRYFSGLSEYPPKTERTKALAL